MFKSTSVFVALILFTSADKVDQSCPEIKTRNMWEAAMPKTVDYQLSPVPNVIIMHTASFECATFRKCVFQLKNIQAFHQEARKWPDIAYNFLIGNDGNIYEGVGWHKVGTHTSQYNNGSIGIAFIGNYSDVLPSKLALQAAKDLLKCGVDTKELAEDYQLFGARQLVKTESPGITLYGEIQGWDNWQSTALLKV